MIYVFFCYDKHERHMNGFLLSEHFSSFMPVRIGNENLVDWQTRLSHAIQKLLGCILATPSHENNFKYNLSKNPRPY